MKRLRVGSFIFVERKFLGLGQYRKGTNKVSFKGYIQFLYDMFKFSITKVFFKLKISSSTSQPWNGLDFLHPTRRSNCNLFSPML